MGRDKLTWNNVSSNANVGTSAMVSGSQMLAGALKSLRAPLDRANEIDQANADSQMRANTGAYKDAILRGEDPELTGMYNAGSLADAKYQYMKDERANKIAQARLALSQAAAKRAGSTSSAAATKKAKEESATQERINQILTGLDKEGGTSDEADAVNMANFAVKPQPVETVAEVVDTPAGPAVAEVPAETPAPVSDFTAEDYLSADTGDAMGPILRNTTPEAGTEDDLGKARTKLQVANIEPAAEWMTENGNGPKIGQGQITKDFLQQGFSDYPENGNVMDEDPALRGQAPGPMTDERIMGMPTGTGGPVPAVAAPVTNQQPAVAPQSAFIDKPFTADPVLTKKLQGMTDYLGDGPDLTEAEQYGDYETAKRNAKENLVANLSTAKTPYQANKAKADYNKEMKKAKENSVKRKVLEKKLTKQYEDKVKKMKEDSKMYDTLLASTGIKSVEDINPKAKNGNTLVALTKKLLDMKNDGVITPSESAEAAKITDAIRSLKKEQDADVIQQAESMYGFETTDENGQPVNTDRKAQDLDDAYQTALNKKAAFQESLKLPEVQAELKAEAAKRNKESGYDDRSSVGKYLEQSAKTVAGYPALGWQKVTNAMKDVLYDPFLSAKDAEESDKIQDADEQQIRDFYSMSDSAKEVTPDNIIAERQKKIEEDIASAKKLKDELVTRRKAKELETRKTIKSKDTDKLTGMISTIEKGVRKVAERIPGGMSEAQIKQFVTKKLMENLKNAKATKAEKAKVKAAQAKYFKEKKIAFNNAVKLHEEKKKIDRRYKDD